MVAVEACGDPLLEGGVWQQIAGELLDCELVEGHVGVERLDDPIAPAPHVPRAIVLIAAGVGIACGVEPGERHLLSIAGRSQQAIDKPFIGIRRAIGDESSDLLGSRWQPSEVEADAPDELRGAGLR
jgi:hypothetical protein